MAKITDEYVIRKFYKLVINMDRPTQIATIRGLEVACDAVAEGFRPAAAPMSLPFEDTDPGPDSNGGEV